jgi:DNA-binding response OmpR family regulator
MKKILVVDDDRDILEVIQIILEDQGYDVHITPDGNIVERKIKEFSPDLILLDIWLAGIDGQDIAARLKKQNETKEIPIVMISAVNKSDQIAQNAGVEDFLSKPFDMDDLISIVAKYIQ